MLRTPFTRVVAFKTIIYVLGFWLSWSLPGDLPLEEADSRWGVDHRNLEDLDIAQREVAASWDDNTNCNTALAPEDLQARSLAGEDLGLCMAEAVISYVSRSLEKERVVEELVAIPWANLTQSGFASVESYSFASREPVSEIDRVASADGLIEACVRFKTIKFPRVVWAGVGGSSSSVAAAADARQSLRDEGAVLIQGVVTDQEFLSRAKEYLFRKAAWADASFTEYVHLAKHRHHLRLQPEEDPIVARLFETLVRSAAQVLLPLVSPLGTVVEFAAFITNPGAAGQHFHVDSGNAFSEHQARLHTVFLFLTDIPDETGGPLQVALRSHALSETRETTRQAVKGLARSEDRAAESQCLGHWQLCPLKSGDAAIYDSTALHRGTSNNSSRARVVAYLSVLGAGALAFGQTYAIDSSLLSPPRRLGNLIAGIDRRRTAEL